MPSGRLFVFGCSMTSYHYPTWADILARQWSFFENWAAPGAGNHFIFNSVVECDLRNYLTADDTIIIMWSNVARHDVYRHNKWLHHLGFSKKPNDPTENCPTGYEIQSYAFMKATHEILTKRKASYIPCSWVQYDMVDQPGALYRDTIKKIKFIPIPRNEKEYNAIYQEKGIEYWKSQYEIVAGKDWPSLEKFLMKDFGDVDDFIIQELEEFSRLVEHDRQWRHKKIIESHPSPLQHLEMAQQVMPDLYILPDTIEWVEQVEKKLNEGIKISFDPHRPIRL